jgi:hypothetical protein
VKKTHPINFSIRPQLGDRRHLLAPGALGVLDGRLTVNGRSVCLYEIGTSSVYYFSPSISGILPVPDRQAWADAIHRDDRDRVLRLHSAALAAGKGYEVMFRYSVPDGPALWVVDRQETVDDVDGRRASGISIDVTDLVLPVSQARRPVHTPLSLEVLCVQRPESSTSTATSIHGHDSDGRSVLPLAGDAYEAWAETLSDKTNGSIIIRGDEGPRERSPMLVSWAPLGAGSSPQLVALAVANIGAHLATSRGQLEHLRGLARSFGGTLLHLAPGGRARVRREWLTKLNPAIESYSDLLERAQPKEVHQLRAARRAAMEGLESYCAVLSCDLGSRMSRLVEVGLPNAQGTEWECLLVALDDDATTQLRQLRSVAMEHQRDARGRLLRALLNEQTQGRVLELLLRVDGHEAHVRRRLAMLGEVRDPVELAARFSHILG